jgi:parvulin-like peptidyl-prolyl isomerase
MAFLVAASSVLVTAGSAWAQTDDAMRVDGYAALVNKHVILQSEVDMAAAPHIRNLARTFEARLRDMEISQEEPPSQAEQQELMREFNEMSREARTRALDALIERYLIVEEFERQDGELPDRVLQDQIQRIIDDRFEGDRSKLVESLQQFQMSFEDFEQQTREDLIAALLRRQELSNLQGVSPQEVLALYRSRIDRYRQPEEVKLKRIALARGDTEQAVAAKRARAEEIRQALLDGGDFAALARDASEGSRADQGGDWGWKTVADLRPELAAATKATPIGQVSEVVEVETDDGGWLYILQVEARKDAGVTPFEQVRDDLRLELEETVREETYRAWIERLKKHHYVKIF